MRLPVNPALNSSILKHDDLLDVERKTTLSTIHRVGFLLATIIGCWSNNVLAVHPFHISTAEVEYDAKTDRLQVSLKLQALDLEQILAKLAGEKVNIDLPAADPKITDYLQNRFYLSRVDLDKPLGSTTTSNEHLAPATARTEALTKLHLVGRELKGAWLLVYFELELPRQRDELQLVNTVLFETTESQINTILVRHSAQRTSLKTTLKQPSAKFPSEWMKTE